MKKRLSGYRFAQPLVVVVLFGAIGVIALLQARAASPSASIESEASSVTGCVETVTDSTASAGKALSFSCPSTQTAQVGSLPVGQANYPIPTGAIFVKAAGLTGGTGTESDPYQSVATAISKAPTGSTLVLRGGTYRETVKIANKSLTIQPYPKEAVWFDGSAPVTGWVQNGSTWVVSNWTYIFDHRVSFGQNMDESSRYVDPAYPMAGYADAVWINGVELTQVQTEAQVTSGKFYVDETNKRLVIGSDPTGKTVEASKLNKAITVQGTGSTLRGFGVKRFAAHLATFGAVSNETNNNTFENMFVIDNATAGIGGWGDNAKYKNLTVSGNGLLGMHANEAHGLSVADSLFTNNNDQRFKAEPVSGGGKFSNTDGAKFANNTFDSNNTFGLWLDVTMRNFTINGNRFLNNFTGLEVELSGHGIIANNFLSKNNRGLFIFDTNDIKTWNNTFYKNSRSIQILQDARRNTNSATMASVPWVVADLKFHNNTFALGTDNCPNLVQDQQGLWTGDKFGITSNGNVWHRTGATSPANFYCWANSPTSVITSYKTMSSFATATGNETTSKYYEGTEILSTTGQLNATTDTATAGAALPLPDDIATAIGETTGDKKMGAYLVR